MIATMPNKSRSFRVQYSFAFLFVIVFTAALIAWELGDQRRRRDSERAYEATVDDYRASLATDLDVLRASRMLLRAEERTLSRGGMLAYERHVRRLQNDL